VSMGRVAIRVGVGRGAFVGQAAGRAVV
jgi:hypothetical protein